MHCKLGESWLCFLPQSPGRCFPSPSCSFWVSSLKQLCRIPAAGLESTPRQGLCGSRGSSPRAEGKGGFPCPQNRGRELWVQPWERRGCHQLCPAGRVGGLAPALGIFLQEFASSVSTVELFLCSGFFSGVVDFLCLFLKYINENLLLELGIVTPGF